MAGKDNLKPFEEGDDPRRNTNGRPQGSRNWSNVVQELLEDENLADKLLTKKPSYWSVLKRKDGANLIVTAMIARSVSGDVKAAEWLRKTGFGDKLDVNLNAKLGELSNEQLAAIARAGIGAADDLTAGTGSPPVPKA